MSSSSTGAAAASPPPPERRLFTACTNVAEHTPCDHCRTPLRHADRILLLSCGHVLCSCATRHRVDVRVDDDDDADGGCRATTTLQNAVVASARCPIGAAAATAAADACRRLDLAHCYRLDVAPVRGGAPPSPLLAIERATPLRGAKRRRNDADNDDVPPTPHKRAIAVLAQLAAVPVPPPPLGGAAAAAAALAAADDDDIDDDGDDNDVARTQQRVGAHVARLEAAADPATAATLRHALVAQRAAHGLAAAAAVRRLAHEWRTATPAQRADRLATLLGGTPVAVWCTRAVLSTLNALHALLPVAQRAAAARVAPDVRVCGRLLAAVGGDERRARLLVRRLCAAAAASGTQRLRWSLLSAALSARWHVAAFRRRVVAVAEEDDEEDEVEDALPPRKRARGDDDVVG